MPVLHDMECSLCGEILYDQLSIHKGEPHSKECSGILEVVFLPRRPQSAAVHASERVVLYYSEKEGKFQYPGRNDVPVPARLQRRGYQKREFTSARELAQHERRHNVCSHALNYDKNGRSFDGSDS